MEIGTAVPTALGYLFSYWRTIEVQRRSGHSLKIVAIYHKQLGANRGLLYLVQATTAKLLKKIKLGKRNTLGK